jgi:L-ascorbate 6-phosphate lactonase
MINLATVIRDLSLPSGSLAVFWLGGAGFAFKTSSGKIVYVDPYLSDSLDHFYSWKRLPGSPIPFPPSEVEADLVLATHAHEDHLDPHSIPDIATSSEAIIAGPTLCAQTMRDWGIEAERIVEINRGETRKIAGVPVSAVFAHHESEAGASQPDAVGFVLDLEGTIVYHSGDTLYHPQLQGVSSFEPDIMLVCINGQYGNMTPEEAGRLTNQVEPDVVIPMHWGLVSENTADPADFVAALVREGSRARPVVIGPGDSYLCCSC